MGALVGAPRSKHLLRVWSPFALNVGFGTSMSHSSLPAGELLWETCEKPVGRRKNRFLSLVYVRA